jgi:membrane-bound ClpP family serine protease
LTAGSVCVPAPLGASRPDAAPLTSWRPAVIVLGIILLVIGFITKIAILWSIGIVLVVIGLILALLGFAGREVAGRRHWY